MTVVLVALLIRVLWRGYQLHQSVKIHIKEISKNKVEKTRVVRLLATPNAVKAWTDYTRLPINPRHHVSHQDLINGQFFKSTEPLINYPDTAKAGPNPLYRV